MQSFRERCGYHGNQQNYQPSSQDSSRLENYRHQSQPGLNCVRQRQMTKGYYAQAAYQGYENDSGEKYPRSDKHMNVQQLQGRVSFASFPEANVYPGQYTTEDGLQNWGQTQALAGAKYEESVVKKAPAEARSYPDASAQMPFLSHALHHPQQPNLNYPKLPRQKVQSDVPSSPHPYAQSPHYNQNFPTSTYSSAPGNSPASHSFKSCTAPSNPSHERVMVTAGQRVQAMHGYQPSRMGSYEPTQPQRHHTQESLHYQNMAKYHGQHYGQQGQAYCQPEAPSRTPEQYYQPFSPSASHSPARSVGRSPSYSSTPSPLMTNLENFQYNQQQQQQQHPTPNTFPMSMSEHSHYMPLLNPSPTHNSSPELQPKSMQNEKIPETLLSDLSIQSLTALTSQVENISSTVQQILMSKSGIPPKKAIKTSPRTPESIKTQHCSSESSAYSSEPMGTPLSETLGTPQSVHTEIQDGDYLSGSEDQLERNYMYCGPGRSPGRANSTRRKPESISTCSVTSPDNMSTKSDDSFQSIHANLPLETFAKLVSSERECPHLLVNALSQEELSTEIIALQDAIENEKAEKAWVDAPELNNNSPKSPFNLENHSSRESGGKNAWTDQKNSQEGTISKMKEEKSPAQNHTELGVDHENKKRIQSERVDNIKSPASLNSEKNLEIATSSSSFNLFSNFTSTTSKSSDPFEWPDKNMSESCLRWKEIEMTLHSDLQKGLFQSKENKMNSTLNGPGVGVPLDSNCREEFNKAGAEDLPYPEDVKTDHEKWLEDTRDGYAEDEFQDIPDLPSQKESNLEPDDYSSLCDFSERKSVMDDESIPKQTRGSEALSSVNTPESTENRSHEVKENVVESSQLSDSSIMLLGPTVETKSKVNSWFESTLPHIKAVKENSERSGENVEIESEKIVEVGISENVNVGSGDIVEVGLGEIVDVGSGQNVVGGIGEDIEVGSGENVEVGSEENVEVGSEENVDVGSGEKVEVGSGEKVEVGSGEKVEVGSGEKVEVGSGENVEVGSGENVEVGIGENVEVGIGENVEVGIGENVEVGIGENVEAENVKVGIGENVKAGFGENVETGIGENVEVGNVEVGIGENVEVGIGENVEVGIGENVEVGIGENVEVGIGSQLKVDNDDKAEILTPPDMLKTSQQVTETPMEAQVKEPPVKRPRGRRSKAAENSEAKKTTLIQLEPTNNTETPHDDIQTETGNATIGEGTPTRMCTRSSTAKTEPQESGTEIILKAPLLDKSSKKGAYGEKERAPYKTGKRGGKTAAGKTLTVPNNQELLTLEHKKSPVLGADLKSKENTISILKDERSMILRSRNKKQEFFPAKRRRGKKGMNFVLKKRTSLKKILANNCAVADGFQMMPKIRKRMKLTTTVVGITVKNSERALHSLKRKSGLNSPIPAKKKNLMVHGKKTKEQKLENPPNLFKKIKPIKKEKVKLKLAAKKKRKVILSSASLRLAPEVCLKMASRASYHGALKTKVLPPRKGRGLKLEAIVQKMRTTPNQKKQGAVVDSPVNNKAVSNNVPLKGKKLRDASLVITDSEAKLSSQDMKQTDTPKAEAEINAVIFRSSSFRSNKGRLIQKKKAASKSLQEVVTKPEGKCSGSKRLSVVPKMKLRRGRSKKPQIPPKISIRKLLAVTPSALLNLKDKSLAESGLLTKKIRTKDCKKLAFKVNAKNSEAPEKAETRGRKKNKHPALNGYIKRQRKSSPRRKTKGQAPVTKRRGKRHNMLPVAPKEPEIKLKYVSEKPVRAESRARLFMPYVKVEKKNVFMTTCTIINTVGEEARMQKERSAVHSDSQSVRLAKQGNLPLSSRMQIGPLVCKSVSTGCLLCCLCRCPANYKDLGDLCGPYYPMDCLPAKKSRLKEKLKSDDLEKSSKVIESHCTGGGGRPACMDIGSTDQVRHNALRSSARGLLRKLPGSYCCNKKLEASETDKPRRHQCGKFLEPHATEAEAQEHWVHEACAVWTSGVYLVAGKLYGIQEAIQMADSGLCPRCQKPGATVGCSHKGCAQSFHYTCATEAGCILTEENFSLRCPKHKRLVA